MLMILELIAPELIVWCRLSNSNSISIFIVLNLHLKTDFWCVKTEIQKAIIIYQDIAGISAMTRYWEKQKLGWKGLCKEIGFELLSN